MKPMFLAAVENKSGSGPYEAMIEKMKADGAAIPQIFHLIRYKPNVGRYLTQLTQEVMRGPSPLSAGLRELIAAFTSSRNLARFESRATPQLRRNCWEIVSWSTRCWRMSTLRRFPARKGRFCGLSQK